MPKGGELIAEFLIRSKIPYVFGICGMEMSECSTRSMM